MGGRGVGGRGGAVGGHLSKGQLLTGYQWGKSFYRQKEGIRVETAQPALTVTFKLVIGALTGVILTVLGTVKLQFQGQFVFRYFEASSWNRGSL